MGFFCEGEWIDTDDDLVKYRQCRLVKKLANSTVSQVSYIPEPFCVQGKTLKLRTPGMDDVWEDGWVVEEVWDRPRLGKELPDPQYIKHPHPMKRGKHGR